MRMRSNNGQVVTNSQPTDTRGWMHSKKMWNPLVSPWGISFAQKFTTMPRKYLIF